MHVPKKKFVRAILSITILHLACLKVDIRYGSFLKIDVKIYIGNKSESGIMICSQVLVSLMVLGKTYLIPLTPLPDGRGLHTKEGKWVPADNNHPNHQQFEYRQEGSNVPVETKEETGFYYSLKRWHHKVGKCYLLLNEKKKECFRDISIT